MTASKSRRPAPTATGGRASTLKLPPKPARIVVALGSSGTGKTSWVKQQVAKERKLLIWDYNHEHLPGGASVHQSIMEFCDSAICSKPPACHVLRPLRERKHTIAQFACFCELAYLIGDVAIWIEELKFVTEPSRAPEAWARLTLTGRHKSMRIYGTSQRPAQVDKDFLGNATLIHCGRLTYPEDRQAAAKVMGINPDELGQLKDLEYLEWEPGKPVRRGILKH